MFDLEKELHQLLGEGTATQIAMRLYGFDGRGGASLRQLAKVTGLNYETIRKRSAGLVRDRVASCPATPILDRAIEFIADQAPASAGDIERRLTAGRSGIPAFRLEGVINAAGLLGRPVRFALARNVSGRVVYVPTTTKSAPVLHATKKLIRTRGMTRIGDVAAVLSSQKCISSDDVISALIETRKDFCWLNQRLGWFWLSRFGRNKVANRLRKMLSVSSSLSLGEAYAGMEKDYRLAAFGPPLSVFAEFCRQMPGLQVIGDTIIPTDQIDRNDVLSPAERKLVSIMKRHKVPITFTELVKAAGEAGVASSSAGVFASTSPLVRNLRRGVYGLIGRSNQPA